MAKAVVVDEGTKVTKAGIPESVLVEPVTGKYCEVVYTTEGGATSSYKIWKVHPNTLDVIGTKIPYEVAVSFLGKVPPVITLVPLIEKGVFVSQLSEEDQKTIQEAQERGFSGGRNYNVPTSVDPKDANALEKTAKLLQEQTAKNAALESQLTNLVARLDALEKAPAPTT
jgi:hypothetical protein